VIIFLLPLLKIFKVKEMKKDITREEAELFSKELHKELIKLNWTEYDAASVSNNIDYLMRNIIPYQTPLSYAEIMTM
jgi:hypothetical protein